MFVGNQFGFLKDSSCVSAAIQLVDFVKLNYKRKLVSALFIDLQKAFDTVDINRLSRKLKRLGLSHKAAHLQNRKTATAIGNSVRDFRSIKIGVCTTRLETTPFYYLPERSTDDAALLYALDTPEQLKHAMEHDINLPHGWLSRNVLSLNVGKTCFMTFGRANDNNNIDIPVDGTTIILVTKFKYLGLNIDCELNFNDHVDHIKRQIAPFISLMWRKWKYIPVEKRKQLYFAYVHSQLLCMLPIYVDCAESRFNGEVWKCMHVH